MKWKKLGLVYAPTGEFWWARQAAMIPTPIVINDKTIRVYMTCCDDDGIGRIGQIDLDYTDPTKILNVHKEPVLDIGQPGTFDDNGVLVCSVLSANDTDLYMYYAGFELSQKIRYRLLTGLATKSEKTSSFSRVFKSPVLDRSNDELFFRGGPFALNENGLFKIWYVAGSSWEKVGNQTKPVYEIRYLESNDGINWGPKGTSCIKIEHENEHGFGRPYVVKHDNKYHMFYSVRRRDVESYRLGYAVSDNGLDWERKDDELNLDVSDSGWDSNMICYSAVIKTGRGWHMFYNGNGFGKTGFGVAELLSW